MSDVYRFRMAMAKYLGKVVTPEVAAQIEAEAFHVCDASIDPARFEPRAYRGLVFAVESFRLIRDEMHVLHELHWAETERARHGLALNPSYEYANAAERRGDLLQVTARQAGKLVGHARFYLFEDIHTRTRAAKEDVFYLAAEARHAFNAIRLWQYAEACLKAVGVREVRTDSKIIHDASGAVIRDVGAINRYLGYAHVSNGWLKTL